MSVNFNGKFLIQPQTSVYVNNSKLFGLGATAPNTLALVGPSSAGVPQTPVLLQDPTTAQRVLRSGDLLNATLLAFGGSSQTGGATSIYVVRVNSAVQSRAKIFDVTAATPASATATVGGTPAAGNTFTVTIAGVASTYTAVNGDTTTSVATGIANAINGNTSTTLTDAINGVVASSSGAVVTVTAKYPGVDGNTTTFTASTVGGAITASGATLAGGTGNTLATITSNDYGLYTSQIYFQFAAGSISGTKATVGLTTTGNLVGGVVVQDNISRNLITIQYTGAGTACTLTVNDSTLTTSVTGAPADNLNIAFATFGTIQQVSDAINATGKYTCTVASNASSLSSASQFDNRNAVDVKTAAVTLTANLQALFDFLNSSSNPFFKATRKANPTASLPGFTGSNQYLVGGSDGTTANQDWTTAINALQKIDVDIVVPVTDNATYHAAVLAHVQYMSSTARQPRRAIVGGALGEYNPANSVPTQLITSRAAALDSSRIMLVSPGINYYDAAQTLQSGSSAFTAALVAGMASAVEAGEPLTHKYLSNVVSLETTYLPADLDTLLLGGVCPIEVVQGRGFRIVKSRTTWTGDTNYANVEWSTGAAIDQVTERLQDALDDNLVGQPISPMTLALSMSITETVLNGCANDGLIVGDSNNPPFTNIQASAPGDDTIRVSAQISPAIPANYILMSVSTVPYTGTIATQ